MMHYVTGISCPARSREKESPHLVSPPTPQVPVLILLRARVSMVTDNLLLFSPILHFTL
jgi:hypothetical protein